MTLTLNRDVTTEECPWLSADLAAGTEVLQCFRATYGCISPTGVAVSWDGDYPFFEVPLEAVGLAIT